MDSKLKRVYVPMSETALYTVLFCKSPSMDTGIGQEVKEMTKGESKISPGDVRNFPRWRRWIN